MLNAYNLRHEADEARRFYFNLTCDVYEKEMEHVDT